MPIYAYRCEDCGHAQDFLQRISDPLMDTCPSCGSKGFRKQVTAAGFQLKGEGWYVTDFRDGGKKDAKKAGEDDGKRAAAESGSEAKSEGKSEGKADTKSDGKGDAKSGSEADVKPAKPSTPAPASTPSKPTSGGDTKAA